MVPIPSSGTISVLMTKDFVLTRVRYSRLKMSQVLRMACFLNKYVVEGGFQ